MSAASRRQSSGRVASTGVMFSSANFFSITASIGFVPADFFPEQPARRAITANEKATLFTGILRSGNRGRSPGESLEQRSGHEGETPARVSKSAQMTSFYSGAKRSRGESKHSIAP